MKVDFKRLTWENYPSTDTPINADNLNRLEEGVAGLYSDVSEIQEELGGGVGEYVTEWLNEHVDPVGSAVVVDNALTIAGAAADAKKTGDEISDLKDDQSEFSLLSNYGKLIIEQGYFAIANGTPTNSNTWCRTGKLDRTVILKTSTVKMFLLAYDITGNYVGTWNGTEFSTTYNPDSYMRTIEMYRWVETYPQYTFKIDYTSSGTLVPSSVWSDLTVLNSVTEQMAVLNGHVNSNSNIVSNTSLFESGSISETNGGYFNSNYYFRFKNKIKKDDYITRLEVPENGTMQFRLFAWDSTGAFVGIYAINGTWTKTLTANKKFKEIDLTPFFDANSGYVFNMVFESFETQESGMEAVSIHYPVLLDAVQTNKTKISTVNHDIQKGVMNDDVFVYAEFERGQIDASGEVTNSVQYRIVNRERMVFAFPVLIRSAEGFRVYPYLYNETTGSGESTGSWHTEYTVPANQHFRIVVARTVDDTSETADIDTFVSSISFSHTEMYHSISEFNKDKMFLVEQIKAQRSPNFNNDATSISFLHFSDIHANVYNWRRIIEYINGISSYLDFAICTGDYVGGSQADYKNLYSIAKPDTVPVFNVVGNHDTYTDNDGATQATQADTYNILFSDTTGWNVTFGSATNAMYYYKDFASAKIRIVVIDMYYWDSTEESWFANVLADAKANGLSVATFVHEWSSGITVQKGNFNTKDPYNLISPSSIYEAKPYTNILKSFIQGGGTHVCNFCGHLHYDKCGLTADGIFNIVIDAATFRYSNRDSERIEGQKNADCVNLVGIDTVSKVVKVVRIGNNTDHYLSNKNVFVYNYDTKEIVCEY